LDQYKTTGEGCTVDIVSVLCNAYGNAICADKLSLDYRQTPELPTKQRVEYVTCAESRALQSYQKRKRANLL